MIAAVAERLHMSRRGKRWGPCPACHATQLGAEDTRPPVLTMHERYWKCLACGERGDEANLASFALTGVKQPTKEVFDFLRDQGECPDIRVVETPAPVRIDPREALWRALPLREVGDERLVSWLHARRISPLAPAGWLVGYRAPWWPSDRWPVVLPACDGSGVVRSMHGVAVTGEGGSKTIWPKGADATGLVFASARTRAWLAGGEEWGDVVFVEGATDFLTAAVVLDDSMVIGVTAGSFQAIPDMPGLRSRRYYVATDPDRTGREYEQKIARALFPAPVYPFPLVA